MAVGTMVLRYREDDEVHGLARAALHAFATAEGIWLRFEAETERQRGDAAHTAELGILLPQLDVAGLVGRRWRVPRGYDSEAGRDPLATFDESMDLDDNEVDILGQEGDEVRVRWAAVVRGAERGDEGGTRMKVNGRFTFRGVVRQEQAAS